MEDGEIKTEEGYVMCLRDWQMYQDPDQTYEWEIVVDLYLEKFYEEGIILLREQGLLFERCPIFDHSLMYSEATKRQLNEVVIPVKPSNPIGRNDLCPCKSGKKYKHCCYDKR